MFAESRLLERATVTEVGHCSRSPAGLSDVIEEWLRLHDALTENVTVCSNRLNYGADSVPQSVSPERPITSFTKAAAYRMAGAFFRHHLDRRMILVLGDSVTDIDAAHEVPYDVSLSVGFLNSRVSFQYSFRNHSFGRLCGCPAAVCCTPVLTVLRATSCSAMSCCGSLLPQCKNMRILLMLLSSETMGRSAR